MRRNLPASVRHRLTSKAKAMGRPFQEVFQYFAMERFLYRLARSPHAERFVLKGALMFAAWGAPVSRPTKDVDLLARMDNVVETITGAMRQVCGQEVEPDGLAFDLDSVAGAAIKEDADYPGVRVTFLVTLETARATMQIDVGFGDVVTPAPSLTAYPAILDFAPPRLLGYPRETAVAEKFEAMAKLGLLNSRMKDFYDIWLLARRFAFEGGLLADAIRRTFAHRRTSLSGQPPFALTAGFWSDPAKARQWQGFVKKTRLEDVPMSLEPIIGELALFLLPVAEAVARGNSFDRSWAPSGPWTAH